MLNVDLHSTHTDSYFSLSNKFRSGLNFGANLTGIYNKTPPPFFFTADCLSYLNIACVLGWKFHKLSLSSFLSHVIRTHCDRLQRYDEKSNKKSWSKREQQGDWQEGPQRMTDPYVSCRVCGTSGQELSKDHSPAFCNNKCCYLIIATLIISFF